MAGWNKHKGLAVALSRDNLDTDQLIPARFMSIPRSQGYGGHLLYDLRRDEEGSLLANFPLNQHPTASVIVGGQNFGIGSSREAAVYGLVDAGFKAVIATSFGDIFAGNAINNGLLPALVEAQDLDQLTAEMADGPLEVSIDLEEKSIRFGQSEIALTLDEGRATKLINGWDDIDVTLEHASLVEQFRRHRNQTTSWARPAVVE